ncbi:MAG TPA: ATP-binding protein [Candidatus Merdivicinus intestinigallinarum]|nr:ATP-binding protein [Candidatus Merdivicinus intestinigallinarum]
MNITSGIIHSAQKIVLYGPEGIGKSTFASQMPDPVFIDTEGSTKKLNVRRMDKPQSFAMLLEQVRYIRQNPTVCKTLVIDTADWAEMLCIRDLCAKNKKTGIEDFGYGKGYVYLAEDFGKLLNELEEVVNSGIHVLLTAHAAMRKFEQPDEMGQYDRWEMKLGKKTAPLLKEWADMVLFANYKTITVKTAENKVKAQGGSRVMYTTHHPCWDAKNRDGLPEELPFEFAQIAHLLGGTVENPVDKIIAKAEQIGVPVTVTEPSEKTEWLYTEPDERVPKQLRELMIAAAITEDDVEWAVSEKGYFPKGMRIWEYPADFIDGVLVGAWNQVSRMILDRGPKE